MTRLNRMYKKIFLEPDEKIVFWEVRDKQLESSLSKVAQSDAAHSLGEKGFVKCQFFPHGDNLRFAELTTKGKAYLERNPKLRNPMSENQRFWITTCVAICALILALIALIRTF